MQITCIEPYPFAALNTIPGIEIIEKQAQDVPPSVFETLDANDVLFIDSSHALKIDSDVAYLFLEILPRLRPGVRIHIHDIPFPYNVPFPARRWIFGNDWPVYWDEAMLVQALLSNSNAFRIQLSAPLIRHFHEDFLRGLYPALRPVQIDDNPYSALWLERI